MIMNWIGWAIIAWCIATFIALFVQLVPGMPPIGFALFVVGSLPAAFGLFFIEFKP
jgi:hypothetical protein